MIDHNATTTSAHAGSTEPGKSERSIIPPRDLIYLVAGRFYSEHYSSDVNMLPWCIDKALNLWNALNDEIRDRGWVDLLEVAQ